MIWKREIRLAGYQENPLKHWHLGAGMVDIEIMAVAAGI